MRNSLQCFDFTILENSTFTYISNGNTYCKWLDHVIGLNTRDIVVSDTRVLYDVIGSDHLPLTATIQITATNKHTSDNSSYSTYKIDSKYVDWEHLSSEDIDQIERRVLIMMGNYREFGAVHYFRLGCS